MDPGPTLLGLDPAFEVTDRLFEADNRGFHLSDATARFGDARLVAAIDILDDSPIAVLARVSCAENELINWDSSAICPM